MHYNNKTTGVWLSCEAGACRLAVAPQRRSRLARQVSGGVHPACCGPETGGRRRHCTARPPRQPAACQRGQRPGWATNPALQCTLCREYTTPIPPVQRTKVIRRRVHRWLLAIPGQHLMSALNVREKYYYIYLALHRRYKGIK